MIIARDWTKGSIIGNVLSLAWPMAIGSSINMLGSTIDMIWVGKLGVASVAGVGIAGMLVMLVDSLGTGLSTGLRAIIARSIGSGDIKEANHAGQQSFVIIACYSITIATIGILFARPMLLLFGLQPDVVKEASTYMRIMFVGRVTMSLWMMCEAMMQASGDTRTPVKISVGFRVLHMALSPFLIFGWGIFPRLGVGGAAMTNIFSQGTGAAIGLWVLFSGRSRLHLNLKAFRFDPKMISRIVKIGIPASVSNVERSFGSTVIMLFTAPFGTMAVAAHTICDRVDMAFSAPAMATGNAAGVLAGQNLGAGQPSRATSSVWMAAAIGDGLMVTLSLVLLVSPQVVASIFTSDPQLLAISSVFLRIMVAYFLMEGLRMVFLNSLNTIGDTLPTMLVSLLSRWVIYVPLAYFLPGMTNLGVLGIRWAMVINTIVQAIILMTYFRLGRWKRKNI